MVKLVKEAVNGIEEAKKTVQDITNLVTKKGILVTTVEGLGSTVVTVVDNALEVLEEPNIKKNKYTYEARDALNDLVSVVATACIILDRISSVLHFCLGVSMTAAKDGLHCSPPNLKPLQDLISLLKRSWTTAKRKKKWESFSTACQAASQRFNTIAEKCANEERTARNKKRTVNFLGGGVIIMIDVGALFVLRYFEFSAANATALWIAVGLFLWIIGKGLQCMVMHYFATDFGKSEQDFRHIQSDLDSLWTAAHEIRKALSEVRNIDSNIAAQVDTIDGCVDNNANIVLLRDAVQELIRECEHSSGAIRKWKKDLTDRKEKLFKVEL